MLYYRYRSPSELSFKELLYSEIFFSSTEECNDPFDSKTFYEFQPDQQRWEKLFELALGNLAKLIPDAAANAATKMVKRGTITLDEAMSMDFASHLRIATKIDDPFFLSAASASIMRLFELYKPESNYFVSFSRRCDEPLMWSHYAGRHEGYCLIFRSVGGALYQNALALKTSARREAPKSFSPFISRAIPDRFKFCNVEYKETVEHLNAFDRFPETVAMKVLSDTEAVELTLKQNAQYFQKHESWSYEEETRITLRAPEPWLFQDRFEYSHQERLFQYEPSQLVGIILGARMSESHKKRILQILEERDDRISGHTSYKRILFDFLLQEANLSTRHRQLDIAPLQFIGRVNTAKPGEPKFDSAFERWKTGCGIEIDGNRATSVQILD